MHFSAKQKRSHRQLMQRLPFRLLRVHVGSGKLGYGRLLLVGKCIVIIMPSNGMLAVKRQLRRNTVISVSPRLAHAKYGISVTSVG